MSHQGRLLKEGALERQQSAVGQVTTVKAPVQKLVLQAAPRRSTATDRQASPVRTVQSSSAAATPSEAKGAGKKEKPNANRKRKPNFTGPTFKEVEKMLSIGPQETKKSFRIRVIKEQKKMRQADTAKRQENTAKSKSVARPKGPEADLTSLDGESASSQSSQRKVKKLDRPPGDFSSGMGAQGTVLSTAKPQSPH